MKKTTFLKENSKIIFHILEIKKIKKEKVSYVSQKEE